MGVDYRNKKFLVVDDFSDMRLSLKRMLEAFGAQEVDQAANGDDAVARIGKRRYDIILCDYNLGEGKDGQQVLEESKLRGLIDSTTVFVMVTAESTVQMVLGALEFLPDDYLSKPFTKEILKLRLEKLTARKDQLSEIDRAVAGKDYDTAIALCDAQIQGKSRYLLDLLKIKAESCLAAGRYDEAGSAYEQALALREMPWAKIGLGKVQVAQERYGEARELFQAVVSESKANTEAHDWLARTHEELGNLEDAQRTLEEAISISPKSLARQRALAAVAIKNNDQRTAERSLRSAIRIGRHSFFKAADDYTSLAKTLIDSGQALEAIKVLGSAEKEFVGDTDACIRTGAMKSAVYRQTGRQAEAERTDAELAKMIKSSSSNGDTDLILKLAKVNFELGNTEAAQKCMEEYVRNNYEDEELVKKAQDLYREVGLQQEGADLIETVRQRMTELNNQGVALVKSGQLEDAIKLFLEAADGAPGSKTINLNAAQVLIMQMEKSGVNRANLARTKTYLNRAQQTGEAGEKYAALSERYKKLAQS